MKATKTFIDPLLWDAQEQKQPVHRPDERSMSSYARDLRVVGQLLESRDIHSADLVWVADTYVVRGNARSAHKLFSRGWLTRIGALFSGDMRRSLRSEILDLRYTLEEIARFDHLAQTKRSGFDRMPDPYSLSHILRTAGAYLDGRVNSLLIGISLQKRWVTIRFETSEGRPEEATQDISYFYNYWVKMYLRRGSRARILPDGQAPEIHVPRR